MDFSDAVGDSYARIVQIGGQSDGDDSPQTVHVHGARSFAYIDVSAYARQRVLVSFGAFVGKAGNLIGVFAEIVFLYPV
ncbi:hypothetical protein J25TS5_16300 [Paenibacillus faecis]|nr:hypothetical protein J25TS5_16300 [Paenibacillus faecis]